MFVITQLRDTVRLVPDKFSKDRFKAVKDELNAKYANKVLPDVGLCIAVWELSAVGESYLYPGDGAAHSKVDFRLLVFRPFDDEIIVGKVAECTPAGVTVSLGFFQDIHIPQSLLQQPSVFDATEKLWVWKFEGNDLFMDVDEPIRVRVKALEFHTPRPAPPAPMAPPKPPTAVPAPSGGAPGKTPTNPTVPPAPGRGGAATAAGVPVTAATSAKGGGAVSAGSGTASAAAAAPAVSTPAPAPMLITAAANEDGLGLTAWWTS